MSQTIEHAPTQAIVPLPEPTPMAMLQLAVQQNADIDKLAKLMDLEERWRAAQARKAFVAAMTAFKAEPVKILKTKRVDIPGGAKFAHATLADVVDGVCASLSRHGLSHKWETSQEGGRIVVTCVLTHQAGHSERVTLEAPPDDSGKKNSIQQIASTVTYLQRYTLMAATGLAASDMDDDGAAAGKKEESNDPALIPWRQKLEDAGSLRALSEVWKEMPEQHRKALTDAMTAARKRVREAEAAAAASA